MRPYRVHNDIHSFVKSKALKVYQKDLDNPKPKAPKPPPPPNTPKANMVAAGGTGVPVINAILNPNMSDCIDWQLDGCKWGNMCRFKHDPSTKGKGRENGLTERLAAMAAKPCFDFKAGTCKRGDRCRFSHAGGEKVEVLGFGLGLGSGLRKRVRRRNRSTRRRGNALVVISDDRVSGTERLVDVDFSKSHDGPLGCPVCDEGTSDLLLVFLWWCLQTPLTLPWVVVSKEEVVCPKLWQKWTIFLLSTFDFWKNCVISWQLSFSFLFPSSLSFSLFPLPFLPLSLFSPCHHMHDGVPQHHWALINDHCAPS